MSQKNEKMKIENTQDVEPVGKVAEKENVKGKIIGELSKASNAQVKVFSFSMNPIIILVSAIIGGLLLYNLFKPDTTNETEIGVDKFIENIKSNDYSKLDVYDDGKIVGVEKYVAYVELTKEDNVDEIKDIDKVTEVTKVGVEEEIKQIELKDFVELLKPPTVKEILNISLLNKHQLVQKVLWNENDLIAKVLNGPDVYVKNVTKDSLKLALANEKDLKYETLGIEEINLDSATAKISLEDFKKAFFAKQYSDVWVVDGGILAVKFDKNLTSEYTMVKKPLSDDFAGLLGDNGINIDSKNFELTFKNVPRIDYVTVMQILSLLVIGFLVFSILRGIGGSGNKLMQFGESKAKIFFGKKADITFKDVAGIDSAKEELEEVVTFLKEPKKFLKLGARIPKGLLMVGPPGTGKTLLAKAIAGEAGVPFFHTSGSEFEEMLVGAGASRVRDLFAKARKASPSLIFIDEVDAVARKRGTTLQSSSTEQTLNQILVEMDGFEKNTNVIVIAATNRPDVIDPAILRPGRFDRRIVIDLPDIDGREEILKIHAKDKPLAKDVDLRKVAKRTVGYAGADLENMLNEAAIIVGKENRNEITSLDVEEAATRVGMGRERKLTRTKDELKKTAYHEAGHAIMAKLTPESDPVHRVTIVSRGMALGVTMQLPERDKYSQSYTEMESRLRVLMGGRAAEEILNGPANITSGASNDIEKATSLARRMVKQFGYSKKLGLVKYGESNDLQYLGYGYGEQRDYSEETARLIDDEVKTIINAAYDSAVKVLNENRKLLDKISDDLLEKEIIEGEEFDKYF